MLAALLRIKVTGGTAEFAEGSEEFVVHPLHFRFVVVKMYLN